MADHPIDTEIRLKVAAHGVLETGAALQITVKRHLHLKDLADVVHRQRLPLVDSQSLGRADGVLDLATVELVPSESVVVLLREGHQVNLLENAHALNKDLEDGLLCALVEAVVAQRNVDSRLKSIIKRLWGVS